jgi:2,4-dienoyl-CoA reductase (NADPH2)
MTAEAATQPKKVAVVGAGMAGLSCATQAAARGHQVTLFEAADEIGGQFNLARQIPGKEEFSETLRYFRKQLELTGVELKLNSRASLSVLQEYDEVVVATGVKPRIPDLSGVDHNKVVSYPEAIRHPERLGKKLALLGAGGIGFDVAELLVQVARQNQPQSREDFLKEWGVDLDVAQPGGLVAPETPRAVREIYLLQRKASKPGKGLGKTTGWIHRASLKAHQVKMLAGCEYQKIDDQGLHLRHQDEDICLDVDHIVLCTGQESVNQLFAELQEAGQSAHLIGGAELAAELDARRAIEQGYQLALSL